MSKSAAFIKVQFQRPDYASREIGPEKGTAKLLCIELFFRDLVRQESTVTTQYGPFKEYDILRGQIHDPA